MKIVDGGMQSRWCNVIFEEKWNLSAVQPQLQLPKARECLSAVPSGGMPACCGEMLSLHGLKKWRFHLRFEKVRDQNWFKHFKEKNQSSWLCGYFTYSYFWSTQKYSRTVQLPESCSSMLCFPLLIVNNAVNLLTLTPCWQKEKS